MIYEVTLTQSFFGQQCINRWNYLSTGTPVGITGSAALLHAMGAIDTAGVLPSDTVIGDMQDLQMNSVTFEGVIAKAIREAPTDFFDYGYPTGTVGGGASGDAYSPIAAYGFFTNRVRTDIARGTKRYTGVGEGSVDTGGVVSSAALSFMNTMAEHLSDVLSYTDGGNSLTFAPIVVSKKKTVVGGKPRYNYYDTIAEQLEHIAQGIVWTPYPTVRSQVSRQYKHGA
jgi:hypothetical protein